MSSAFLPHRGVLKISGDDKANFLQGIVTQDMRHVSADKFLYGCFLTPQGKYLVDFFITQSGDEFLLDVDKVLLPDFIKRLTMYKLRSKVTLEDVSAQYRVYAFWDKAGKGFADPRFEKLGTRLITAEELSDSGDDYTLWLMQNGVADMDDFERERTTMLEANVDLLNGISWDKGCYMGQELTARTHYRGLVKKRFLPLRFSSDVNFEKETPVLQDGKNIGLIRRCHKSFALAKLEVEAVEKNPSVMVGDQQSDVVFPRWFTQP